MKVNSQYLEKLLKAFAKSEKSSVDLRDLERSGFNYKDDPYFMFHMQYLIDKNFIEREDKELGFGYDKAADGAVMWSVLPLRITASGYEFYEELVKRNKNDLLRVERHRETEEQREIPTGEIEPEPPPILKWIKWMCLYGHKNILIIVFAILLFFIWLVATKYDGSSFQPKNAVHMKTGSQESITTKEQPQKSSKDIIPNHKPNQTIQSTSSESEEITISTGKSETVFNGLLTISLIATPFEGEPLHHRVTATVGAVGYKNSTIDKKDVGFVTQFKGKELFEIRVISADTLHARFRVVRIKQ